MVELYKSLEVLVAREAAKDPKMDTLAAKVEANVKANAPVESGAFRKSIKRVSKAGKRGGQGSHHLQRRPRSQNYRVRIRHQKRQRQVCTRAPSFPQRAQGL